VSTPSDALTILVVEDEADILDVVAYNLRREGYRVLRAIDGRSAVRQAREALPDLVILDVMLPELDGRGVCRALRDDEATRAIPIIMLTARDSEHDVVEGLRLGADDYMTKPFRPRELMARVHAQLRLRARHEPSPATTPGVQPADPLTRRTMGPVVMDATRHDMQVAGQSVRLTATEFKLAWTLIGAPGTVFSRDQLVTHVMGQDAWITERTIDVHVRALRRKLDTHASWIETVRQVGYRWRDTDPS